MPWTTEDVDKHKKGLTDKQKKTWVKAANSALESCLDKGGSQDECEASAIKQANAVAGNQKKERQDTYTCECLDCGEIVESEEHCVDIKCPKCGGEMRRKDRPGKGRAMDIISKLRELWEQFMEAVQREVEEVERKWDGSASNYDSTEAYCKACLIDVNAAAGRDEKAQSHCMLPTKRPGSDSHDFEGIKAAAGSHGIGRVEKPSDVPEDDWNSAVKKAANTIISQYNKNDAPAPDSVYKAAGKEAPERAIGTMRLHEQFYTLLREEGEEWPFVQDIYLDDGGMYGLVVSQGKLYRYPLAVAEDDLQITGERQQVMEIHQPVAERAVTVHRQADGRARWTTVACTAILNRVGEIDSTTLFDNMIRRAGEGQYPYLTLWHLGEPFRMGQADTLARDGVVYIASGLFDEDNELAEAVARDVEEAPDFWGDSIKYKPVGEPEMVEIAEGVRIPVYRDGEHIEISLLPEKRAASWFTTMGVNRQEVNRMKAEVEALLRKVLGDKAEDWIGRVDDINREAEDMVTRAEGDEPGQQDTPPEGDTVELDDEAVSAIVRTMAKSEEFTDVIKPLLDVVERLGTQVEALTKKLDEVGAASTEGLVQVRERLDILERDEEEKQREWLADLPPNRATRVTYRPREANDPDKGNGQPRRSTYGDVAESTLSKIPEYGRR